MASIQVASHFGDYATGRPTVSVLIQACTLYMLSRDTLVTSGTLYAHCEAFKGHLGNKQEHCMHIVSF